MELEVFKNMIESMSFPVLLVDKSKEVIYASPSLNKQFGLKEKDIVGRDIMELIHSKDQYLILQSHHEVLKSGESSETEFRINCGKEIKWMEASLSKVASEESVMYVLRDITAGKLEREKEMEQSNDDEMFGIIKRSIFRDRLKHAIATAKRSKGKVGLLSIDLDLLNNLPNDSTSEVESKILKEVNKRIVKSLRGTDSVTRQGTDEFLVILNEIKNSEDADLVAQKIFDILFEPILINNNEIELVSCIGIAVFPDDSNDFESLLTGVDIAMAEAKSQELSILRIHQKSVENDIKSIFMNKKI